jgi:hypothetical protein
MRNRVLATILRINCRAYGFLRLLYPSTLRSQFGSDMANVFVQQICGEFEHHGLIGVARVWGCVASELIPSAVPRDFLWNRIGLPVSSVLVTLVLFESLLRLTALSTHYAR